MPGIALSESPPQAEAAPYRHPFFADARIELHLRSFYLRRDNFDGSRSQAWAGGGWLDLQTGYLADFLKFGLVAYTSQPIVAPPDEGGTRLLTEDNDALNAIGQAYASAKVAGTLLTGGRQLVDTPLINPFDSRMIPITYEGITLSSLPGTSSKLAYTGGYLWKGKLRDSNDFESFTSILGIPDLDRGAIFGQVRYRPSEAFLISAMNYWIADVLNTGFVEAEYVFPARPDGVKYGLGFNSILQYGDAGDVGTAFTFQASARATAEYRGWLASIAVSSTGEAAAIQAPFGSKPNYTDLPQVSFERAGEDALVLGLTYDFEAMGWRGLTAGLHYGWGRNAIDPLTAAALPDQNELSLIAQFEVQTGPWKGLRLTTRYSDLISPPGGAHQPEVRLILDYTVLIAR